MKSVNSIVDFFRKDNTKNYGEAPELDNTTHSVTTANSNVEEGKGFEMADHHFAPIIPENSPAVLTWENLMIETNQAEPKPLLNNVSGTITGGLWAVMGPSGSGKTTLLSALSLRIDTRRMTMRGDLRLNGVPYTKHDLKNMSAYVMQDDLLHTHLTVSETLWYAAALRMDASFTSSEREERVTEVLTMVGVDYCRDVIVGDTRNKGISGGERKRVCVAIELLTKPKLLFLDEPTSGLDSATALSIMRTLKKLAKSGEMTVVSTIHQPQTRIWEIMDNLILLVKGEICYQGGCHDAEKFFAAQGYPCPPKTNPADFIMDVIAKKFKRGAAAIDISEIDDIDISELESSKEIRMLTVPIDIDFGLDKESFYNRTKHAWHMQFIYLSMRNTREWLRKWPTILINILVAMLIATMVGMGAWRNLSYNQYGVNNIRPIMFFCVIHQGVISSLQGCFAFPFERAIMLRERSAGAYYVSSYFASKSLVDMFFQTIPAVIYSIFVYTLCNFRGDFGRFFSFMTLNILCALACTSIAAALSCICITVEATTIVMAGYLEMSRLYSGFFVPPITIDTFPNWKWMDVMSYMKYTFVGLCVNQYQFEDFYCGTDPITGKPEEVCTVTAGIRKCTCRFTTGNQYMVSFGYDTYKAGDCIYALFIFIVLSRLIGWVALRYIKF